MSRRSLEVVTADYEDGLLIDPQLPITKDCCCCCGMGTPGTSVWTG